MGDYISSFLKMLYDAVANTKVTAGFSVFFGTVWLFGSRGLAEGLDFPPAAHAATGLLCVAFLAVWLTQVVPWLWSAGRAKWSEGRRKAKVIGYLYTLSRNEIEVISNCVRENRQTMVLRHHVGVGPSLTDKGIITPATIGSPLQYSFTIADFVWDRLQKNKASFLDLWGQ